MSKFEQIISAIKNNNLSRLKELLSGVTNKAELLKLIRNGKTILHYAVEHENVEAIKALLLGVKPKEQLELLKVTDSNKKTLLHYALEAVNANTTKAKAKKAA